MGPTFSDKDKFDFEPAAFVRQSDFEIVATTMTPPPLICEVFDFNQHIQKASYFLTRWTLCETGPIHILQKRPSSILET